MAKKKTRQQKVLADQRRHSLAEKSYSYSLEKTNFQPQKSTIISKTSENPYLVADLRKSGILISGIVAFQIVLFFLLKSHTVTIPGLGY